MSHDLNIHTIASAAASGQWQTSNDADADIANALSDIYGGGIGIDFTSNVTLTAAQYRSAMILKPSGALAGARSLTLPAVRRPFTFHNTDATYTVSVIKGSTTIAVAAGKIAVLYTDGTANGLAGSVLSSGTGVGDVVGPGSATNNNIAVFDTTTGKLIKDGGATVASLATAVSVVGK